MYVMKDIAHRDCIKGLVYRFMYVRGPEKMAGKVIRHSDSVFDGFPNMYFIIDFKARLEENKRGNVEYTQKAANEEQNCFTPKDLLQKTFSLHHAGAHLDELQYGGRKPTETSVTEFCDKSVNLFFEKLVNIKVILFLIHELFR